MQREGGSPFRATLPLNLRQDSSLGGTCPTSFNLPILHNSSSGFFSIVHDVSSTPTARKKCVYTVARPVAAALTTYGFLSHTEETWEETRWDCESRDGHS